MRREFYKKLLNKHGIVQQGFKACEELGELIRAISRTIVLEVNGVVNTCNLVEEIADVRIMIEQLMLHYDIWEGDVEKTIDLKIERQMEREKNDEYIG